MALHLRLHLRLRVGPSVDPGVGPRRAARALVAGAGVALAAHPAPAAAAPGWAASPVASRVASPAATRPARAVGVSGAVVHATTAAPVERATVTLLPAGPGALPDLASPFVQGARSTATDAAGRYRFDGVPDGSYVLRVQRLGFRAATVELEVRGTDPRLSVGLVVAPVRLTEVGVRAPAPETYARHAPDLAAEARARVAALRWRQRHFASTDVRELTHADVAEGVSFGETDLFRALQRLPGVAARSDWSAELLTRGARWDQTRVTFDGLPLFDPVHGLGALSAVNADAVGAGFLMPGVRPASVGEGSAAVLDLRSRPGGGDGRLRGVGEFSLLSARAALDQVVGGGRGAVMVAGRRSFAGLLLPELVRNLDDDDRYRLSELVARADWQVGGGRRLEASALYERDVLGGAPNGVPGPAAPDFGPVGPGVGAAAEDGRGALRGNTLGRVTLVSPHGRVEARHTAGASAYGGRLAPAGGLRTSAAYATASGDYAPADAPSGERAPWGAGWALVHQRAAVRGAPDAFAAATADLGDAAPGAASLTQVALWGERRLRPRPALLVEAGLRLEAGGPVVGAGAVRPAPRLAARWTRGETVVSAAAGRAWQYLQARAPGAGFAGETVTQPGTLWLLAGRARPALRTDLATAGVERWYGGGWHASAQAYARAAGGLLVPDPRPVPAPREALALAAEERARGLELGLRRVAGAWTGGAAYTVADARTTVRDAAWGTLRFPSASDRRHAVDVTAARRVTRALRVGGAYTFATGLPFTRELVPGTLVERSGGAEWLPPVRGRPGAERLGASGSLDLSADWTGTIGPARAGVFLQVHNVLRRINPAGYGLSYGCGRECGGTRLVDLTREGFSGPFPVLGARLRF